MLTEDLFHEVLMRPPLANPKINRLLIVSGYASPAMVLRHTEALADENLDITIDLILGMTAQDGISSSSHELFKVLASGRKGKANIFGCRYVVEPPLVHTKAYTWLAGNKPVMAFVGSANYSLRAFGDQQVETMASVDPEPTAVQFQELANKSVDCRDKAVAKHITLTKTQVVTAQPDAEPELMKLSLLDKKTGETPKRSGINWGQRPGRDKNQAYINIPANLRKSGELPERFEKFTVRTDDSKTFTMVRAQDEGKGLETPEDNSLLGKYLRSRLGLKSGEKVERRHLERYGRTDITFFKSGDGNFYLDFGVDKEKDKD